MTFPFGEISAFNLYTADLLALLTVLCASIVLVFLACYAVVDTVRKSLRMGGGALDRSGCFVRYSGGK
jgi:hypothetical protein